MDGAPKAERMRLLRVLALSLAIFAAGLGAACLWLPEWQPGDLQGPQLFVDRYRELADHLGLRLTPGEPLTRLTVPGKTYKGLNLPSSDRLAARNAALSVAVTHKAARDNDSRAQNLTVVFTRDGRPVSIEWISLGLSLLWKLQFSEPEDPRLLDRILPLLLDPGESLGGKQESFVLIGFSTSYLVEGGPARAHMQAENLSIGVSANREIEARELTAGSWLRASPTFFVFFLVCGLFFYLAVKGRIDLVNAGLLGLAALAASDWSHALRIGGTFYLAIAWRALSIFMTWSVAESLMRSTDPESTAGLDAVRAGRFGRRAGRAVLSGVSYGAALAGFSLALNALCVFLPGTAPTRPFFDVPFFLPEGDLLGSGIQSAALVTLAITLLSRLLPARWMAPAAIVASAFLLRPLALSPLPLHLVANLVFIGVLVWVSRRFGLTALLTASVFSAALPAAAFAVLHARWMPIATASLVAGSGYLVLRGFQGLSRPSEIEEVRPPAFVRREAEARRTAYELALLARMQLGLLPQELPALPGYDLAARSLLATEAGGDLYDVLRDEEDGVWIAAGDVAGHGYSCAIAQAMTKSALASLVPSGRSPAGVLGRIHHVLRTGGPARHFTTLALLRLRPETGDVIFSNAGHPPPLLLAEGEVSELALPGLPVGQGPPRTYREMAFRLTPGSTLVFCSDGLYEALDPSESPYGLERAREILREADGRTAAEVLDELLEDWRRHRGPVPQADDTTIVVVRRIPAVAASL